MKVQIEEVDDQGMAHCVTQFGKHMAIPVTVTRAKGALPAVGDQWIIDRSMGSRWSFAAIVNTTPPTITGSRGGNAALGNLLSALEDAGLIKDSTTEGSPGEGSGFPGGGSSRVLSDWIYPTSYIGTAPSGSDTSESVWSITKIVVGDDGGTTTTHAADVKWDDRLVEVYS